MNIPSHRDRRSTTAPPRARARAGDARRLGTVAAVAAVLLAGCASGAPRTAPQTGGPGTAHTPSATSSRSRSSFSADLTATAAATACTNSTKLAGWSNRRLAMLTVAVPVSETSVSDATSEVSAGAGGVLLFGSKAPSDLGSRLTALKTHVPGRLGLLVMTDEEGGGIQRMANLVGSLPWAAYMGAHWTPAQIRQNVATVAGRMSAAQVNMNLAPVVDVDGTNEAPSRTNPDGWRSFSGSTSVVSKAGVAYMNGMLDGHVTPVVKHFPGLGGSSYNSDFGPARTLPWATLQKVALPPFTAAIKAGAPAIMVSNNVVPGLAGNPASLSPTVIGSELRGKLGFKGLVVTDSLSAKAISAAGFSVPSAAVQALRSGADMVMFDLKGDIGSQTSSIATAITRAVDTGRLSRSRLVDAAGHVLAVRHVNLCS
ncbi:glycoside hydrolase family 3 N-terminal domain-containing protein [Streptomyces tropicalis]|uniref:beta-N-acetylhexosaminidase n=1 Tax=Streptomyces tropicalis TaxID=3034234 RepID=A0ABT6AB43_9ACTN|nr:glycoside hydrolase family 3 N-terminal domain-containing protein [Streptomyces tropicalis]MDF3301683.1 glycoside hydrolase family 3 N-terminal domain-containing protein [Streptomyces tropicalis]